MHLESNILLEFQLMNNTHEVINRDFDLFVVFKLSRNSYFDVQNIKNMKFGYDHVDVEIYKYSCDSNPEYFSPIDSENFVDLETFLGIKYIGLNFQNTPLELDFSLPLHLRYAAADFLNPKLTNFSFFMSSPSVYVTNVSNIYVSNSLRSNSACINLFCQKSYLTGNYSVRDIGSIESSFHSDNTVTKVSYTNESLGSLKLELSFPSANILSIYMITYVTITVLLMTTSFLVFSFLR